MPTVFNPSMLRPGDCLVYRPSSLFGWLIAVKTWTKVSHVEGYVGEHHSVGSREHLGVKQYALRTDHLGYVLRPREKFDFFKAMDWFRTVEGQRYDWKSLFCFLMAVHEGSHDRMICSEFMTRWYRAGKFQPFSALLDADHAAPAQFLQSAMFECVWRDQEALWDTQEH